MLPVPEAAMPTRGIYSDRSAVGMSFSARVTLQLAGNATLRRPPKRGSALMTSATLLMRWTASLALLWP